MPKARGTYLAARPHTVNFRTGNRAGTTAGTFQVAFVPDADPHGFPAVLQADEAIFEQTRNMAAGERIELHYIETVLNERIAHTLISTATAAD